MQQQTDAFLRSSRGIHPFFRRGKEASEHISGDKRKIGWRGLSPGLFFLAAAFMAYPYLFSDFSQKVPHGAFPDVLYILSIIRHSITANLSEVYHLPFYYPLGFTLTYGHPLFGISVVNVQTVAQLERLAGFQHVFLLVRP